MSSDCNICSMCRITVLTRKNGLRFTRKLCQKVFLHANHSEIGCVLNWKSSTISYFMLSFLFIYTFLVQSGFVIYTFSTSFLRANLTSFDIFFQKSSSTTPNIFHYISSSLLSPQWYLLTNFAVLFAIKGICSQF